MELQCNSFKLPKLLTFSGRHEFSCKQALRNSFILLRYRSTLSGGKMALKQTLGMTTQHALTTNLAYNYISLILSVFQEKWKLSVLLLFKSKLL